MGTSEAVYTIAFDEGLDISAYLPAEETEAVRRLVAQLRSATPVAPGLAPARGRTKDSKPKPALVTIAGVKVEKLPGMSATTAQEAKTMAEKVYPALYVFENSAREVIAKILEGVRIAVVGEVGAEEGPRSRPDAEGWGERRPLAREPRRLNDRLHAALRTAEDRRLADGLATLRANLRTSLLV